MQEFTYTITDPAGFHARPAGAFVKQAKEFKCITTVIQGSRRADATKLFALMGLGIKGGETVTITTEGEQEIEAAGLLKEFLQKTV